MLLFERTVFKTLGCSYFPLKCFMYMGEYNTIITMAYKKSNLKKIIVIALRVSNKKNIN